jgi:hypothetical protein
VWPFPSGEEVFLVVPKVVLRLEPVVGALLEFAFSVFIF